MAEKGEMIGAEEVANKPSKKSRRSPGKVATTVAGVVGGVIAAVSALPGVNPEGIGTVSAQGRTPEPARPTATLPPPSPTTDPNRVSMSTGTFNEAWKYAVDAGNRRAQAERDKQPVPEKAIEKIIPVPVDTGLGFGHGLLVAMGFLVTGLAGFISAFPMIGRSERAQRLVNRLIHSRFGSRPPAPPAAPPPGGPPAPNP